MIAGNKIASEGIRAKNSIVILLLQVYTMYARNKKGEEIMLSTIVKLGNSQGVRLPKHILDSVNLSRNDAVDITTDGDIIIIRKLKTKKKHKTFEERMAGWNGEYVPEEWDTGNPVGNEVW